MRSTTCACRTRFARRRKPVIVTEALQRLAEPRFTVTVVPVLPGRDGPRREDVLFFDELELVTYD